MPLSEDNQVAIWQVLQENLRTFDEILLKIRGLAVLFAGGALSAASAVHWNTTSSLGMFLILATVPWLGLYLLDRFYYHVLLQATVLKAAAIEKQFFSGNPANTVSAALREFNHSFPLPLTGIKTGGQKVTFFYAMPVVIAYYFGFSFFVGALFSSGTESVWLTQHSEDVALLVGMFAGLAAGIGAYRIEKQLDRKYEVAKGKLG